MLYFILGILFVYLVLPICDSISTIIVIKTEEFKAKTSVKINEYNKQITDGQEEINSCQIGFQYPESEEDDYDEYENKIL